MNKPQEEMQKLGFFDIYKESFKTIFSLRKIFALITLAFILPLSIIFLAEYFIFDVILWSIIDDPRVIHHGNGSKEHHIRTIAYSFMWFCIFKIICIICLLPFSILSTSSIVYTIANLYTGNDVTFKKIIKVVPKVWKRLALTFLWTYLGFFIYNVIAIFVFIIWKIAHNGPSIFASMVFWMLMVIYFIGLIYLTLLWQLASVVTVLETSCGIKAIMKSNTLIKGMRWLSWFVFFILYCMFFGILFAFTVIITVEFFSPLVGGIICIFVLPILFLLGYVVQTMLYLVCKSYHDELISKVGEFETVVKVTDVIQPEQPQPELQV